ncbi:MAG: acyltransferase [Bacteroidales bacterium]|nr:acyltransferase [Bacteroidales bacterium]
MEKKKLSTTYKLLRALGFNYSEEEYGNVSLWRVIKQFFRNIHLKHLEKMLDRFYLEPFAPRKLRPILIRKMGCHVGKNTFFGDYVRMDTSYANMIYIDDYTHITSGCRLLCHQRDLTGYCVGDNAAELGYKTGEIHIGKGVMVGMETLIMPGVTIGDGAIIGAGSIVTKDIPAWTIATGRPARVVKSIPEREIGTE